MDLRRVIRSTLVRAAFLFHGLCGILVLVYMNQEPFFFIIGAGALLFMVEILTTIRCNEKGEWRWFIPSVLIYIAVVAPVIWITEIELLDIRLLQNVTAGNCPTIFVSIETLTNDTCISGIGETVGKVSGATLDLYTFGETFSTLFQQTFMLVLILGRWFMPKGGMTQEELSQLLLVYIAMAADMLEFSIETLRLEEIACERPIFLVILAIWTWSLFQFAFSKSVSGHTISCREQGGIAGSSLSSTSTYHTCMMYFCSSEVWSLLADVVLQDGPYLVVRLYIIFRYRLTENILIFFAVKNFLQVVMQVYRFVVLIRDTRKEEKRLREDIGELHFDQHTMEQFNGGSSFGPVTNDAFPEQEETV